MAESTLLANAQTLLQQLPTIIILTDIMFYVFGALFFGSIAIKGFKGFLRFPFSFGFRMVMGLLSLIGGIGLRHLFPDFSSGIFQVFNADILIGSFLASIILLIGLHLLTFRFYRLDNLNNEKKMIEERIKKAKKIDPKKRGMRDPLKIIGLVLIIGLMVFSLINLRSLPRPSDSFLSYVGLDREELKGLGNQLGQISDLEGEVADECVSVISILQDTGPDITTFPSVTDPQVLSLLASGAGSPMLDVREIRVDGEIYYLGTAENSNLCHAKVSQFCGCFNVGGIPI